MLASIKLVVVLLIGFLFLEFCAQVSITYNDVVKLYVLKDLAFNDLYVQKKFKLINV
jgi:hypothetical protein